MAWSDGGALWGACIVNMALVVLALAVEVSALLCLVWVFRSARRLKPKLHIARRYRLSIVDGKYVKATTDLYLVRCLRSGQLVWGLLILLLTVDAILVLMRYLSGSHYRLFGDGYLSNLAVVVATVLAIHAIYLGVSHLAEVKVTSADPSVRRAFHELRESLWEHTMVLGLVTVILALLALVVPEG